MEDWTQNLNKAVDEMYEKYDCGLNDILSSDTPNNRKVSQLERQCKVVMYVTGMISYTIGISPFVVNDEASQKLLEYPSIFQEKNKKWVLIKRILDNKELSDDDKIEKISNL